MKEKKQMVIKHGDSAVTKPVSTDYASSLILADYYLDLGLDRISDQIRYRIHGRCFCSLGKLDLLMREDEVSLSSSKSGRRRNSLSTFGYSGKSTNISWCKSRSKTWFFSLSRSNYSAG